jgi:hypothetical protein
MLAHVLVGEPDPLRRDKRQSLKLIGARLLRSSDLFACLHLIEANIDWSRDDRVASGCDPSARLRYRSGACDRWLAPLGGKKVDKDRPTGHRDRCDGAATPGENLAVLGGRNVSPKPRHAESVLRDPIRPI